MRSVCISKQRWSLWEDKNKIILRECKQEVKKFENKLLKSLGKNKWTWKIHRAVSRSTEREIEWRRIEYFWKKFEILRREGKNQTYNWRREKKLSFWIERKEE